MSILSQAFSENSLLAAWEKVRAKKAGPGVDGVSIFGFAQNLDRNLASIRHDVLNGGYTPAPVLRRHIPKSDGDFRRIGIPTIRDRIAQRALLNVLLEIVEPRLHSSSYAYRPKRSVRMAVAEIERLRDAGMSWVARIDIDLCFDTIPHAELLEQIDSWIMEHRVTSLIQRWLDAGYIDGAEFAVQNVGVPQGDVISPVLSNIYLDSLDKQLTLTEKTFVRYADDILVVTRNKPEALQAIIQSTDIIHSLGLSTDKEKTGALSFAGGFKYLGTLFVRSMALPAIRIEHNDGSTTYTSGYGSHTPLSLDAKNHGNHIVVTARGGGNLTEQRLSRLVAKELYKARQGHISAVGLALLNAWKESNADRKHKLSEQTASVSDWAFVA